MSGEYRRVVGAIALVIINLLSTCDSECILSLNKDFNNIGPVFIRNGHFLETNTKKGDIVFSRSDTVLISCPKRKIVLANQTTSYDTLEAHCIVNNTFRVDRRILSFKDIRCNSHPWFTTQEKRETCYNGRAQMYQVGYKVKNTFHPIYEACFDKNLVRTHYVQHRITPNSVFRQNGLKRPQFTEGTLFGKIRMNEVYKMNSQVKTLDAILGPKMGDQYLSKIQFLSRGHLAANADYATSALIRATFHYVNTAPQWMRGNAGDWAALEEALRRRVHELGTPVLVYTGNHGMMTLSDKGGRMKEIFLHADLNNNFDVPVPMYFYKLVYEPTQQRASVFITINSSFYNDTMVNDLVFCDNTCDKDDYYNNFKWLRWRSNDGTFSFCCDYDQFARKVDYLPKLDVRGDFIEALRRRVHELGTPVLVYTGNHGMMTLSDKGGRMKEIFLHADLNNNFDVPVPMYFYKLVYEPSQQRASVFITINSSFYNDTMVNDLVFCDNTCDKDDYYNNFKWLRWRSNDGTFSFCCDYDQFARKVDYLPKLDVRGRFY